MANYYATTRSNYFRVRDNEKFEKWVAGFGDIMEINEQDVEEQRLYAIFANGGDAAGWPSIRMIQPETPEEDDLWNTEEVDFVQELSEHLQDGQVAILMEAGAEKARYVIGIAIAVNHKGEVVQISLDDIYDKAADEFDVERTSITDAAY